MNYSAKDILSDLDLADREAPVRFVRSTRARRVSISVSPSSGVRVSVPRGVSMERARAVVAEKSGWITRHLIKFEESRRMHRTLVEKTPPFDRLTARDVLVTRLAVLAATFGFSFNRAFVRSQKTLWGSCSARNNINLNSRLMYLDDDLRDYVILHELAHTRVKNHGPAFWRELSAVACDARALDRELRRYHPALLPPVRTGTTGGER